MKYRYITNNYSGVLANCDIGIQNKNDIENDRQSTINVGGWTDGEERRRRRGLAGPSIGGSSYHATDGMISYCNSVIGTVVVTVHNNKNNHYHKEPQPRDKTRRKKKNIEFTPFLNYNPPTGTYEFLGVTFLSRTIYCLVSRTDLF